VGCCSGRRGAGGVVGQALPYSSAFDIIDYPLHFNYELVSFLFKTLIYAITPVFNLWLYALLYSLYDSPSSELVVFDPGKVALSD
jgi:hypothetical protein